MAPIEQHRDDAFWLFADVLTHGTARPLCPRKWTSEWADRVSGHGMSAWRSKADVPSGWSGIDPGYVKT
ncbi:MAG: hypothetical protein R3268_13680, partial [Acidiferrobacterales bacterium]|nr:hypothetical protein [Acidiferrobacterales bacterium]